MGQEVLLPAEGFERIRAVQDQLLARKTERSAGHATTLRLAAGLRRECELAGLGLQVPSELALLLDCSEWTAHDLLAQAAVWTALPGAMDVLEGGEFTEEQARTVTRALEDLAPADAERVWRVLLARVRGRRAQGVALPPARLGELIAAVVAELLPAELAAKRQASEPDAVADGPAYERHDDGSITLHAYGISGPNGQAALANIARRAQPAGPWDDRTEEQRRRDAITDLLTGRDPLPPPAGDPGPGGLRVGQQDGTAGCGASCGCRCRRGFTVTDSDDVRLDPHPEHVTRCGCRPGSVVPCGVDVRVLVPLATALGLSTVPGLLDGPAGPQLLPDDLLRPLLANGPQLRAVFVTPDGVPVAFGRTVHSPPRYDPHALRQALLRVAMDAPDGHHATHRDGHAVPLPPEPSPVPDDQAAGEEPARPLASGSRDSTRGAARLHPPDLDGAAAHRGDLVPAFAPLGEDWTGVDARGPDGPDGARSAAAGQGAAGAAHARANTGASGPVGAADAGAQAGQGAAGAAPAEPKAGASGAADAGAQAGQGAAGAAHAGGPGPYSIRPALRALLALRAPRCEWPGCGARASRCDQDHDIAWPDGPTCACNLGTLCRRHHRIKQLGWTKTRQPDGSVRWTSPTGRSWTSPSQLPPVPTPDLATATASDGSSVDPAGWTASDQWQALSPDQQHAEQLQADPAHPYHDVPPSDLDWRLADPDLDPLEHLDLMGDAIVERRTAWTLDLADPYRWLDDLPPREASDDPDEAA